MNAYDHQIVSGYVNGSLNVLAGYSITWNPDFSNWLPSTEFNYVTDPDNFPCTGPVITNVAFYSVNNLVETSLSDSESPIEVA